jgi:hypothetical protein
LALRSPLPERHYQPEEEAVPTLSDNYQFGDLLYGLSKVRDSYRINFLKLCEECYMTIDQYNYWFFPDYQWDDRLYMAHGDRDALWTRKDMEENARSTVWATKGPRNRAATPIKVLPDQVEHQTKSISLKKYFDDLTRSKYDPKNLSRDLKEEAFKKKLAVQEKDPNWQRFHLAIRRSCKYGLFYVCNNTDLGIKVHFLLDDIDLAAVVLRELDNGLLRITGSELRCAHRNWAMMKTSGKVLFYLKGVQVAAPWEQQACEDAKQFPDLDQLCKGYGCPEIWDKELEKRRKARSGAGLDALLGQPTSGPVVPTQAGTANAPLNANAPIGPT